MPGTVAATGLIVGASMLAALLLQGVASASPSTGFDKPYAGTAKYEKYAPKQATTAAQVNVALGQKRADRIAKQIGLVKADVFTRPQYVKFITGKGNGGQAAPAKLVDASVRILTNTNGRPLESNVNGVLTPTVLASYGLMVNLSGLLESPANTDAPTRQVNSVLKPGGYMGKWARRNGAGKSIRRLYQSAYTSEAVFGFRSQSAAGIPQLLPNTKGGTTVTVGMSMAPSIWIANFALIYTLNPTVAAKMPAYWTPIPAEVAAAITASLTGQVPYSDFMAVLPPAR